MPEGQDPRKTPSGASLTTDDQRAWQEFLGTTQSQRKRDTESAGLSATDQAAWQQWLKDPGDVETGPDSETGTRPHAAVSPMRQPGPGTLTRADFRRLRSGQWTPEAHLDLHGHGRDEADRLVHRFLLAQHNRGSRLVLVIPGKGRRGGSTDGILNRRVAEMLTHGELAGLVTHFEHAHGTHGGQGAYYVILKRQRRSGRPGPRG